MQTPRSDDHRPLIARHSGPGPGNSRHSGPGPGNARPSGRGKFTLPLGLVTLQGYRGTGSVSVVLAGVVLSLIPTLVVFLFAQRRLVEGLTLGSVKG